MRKMSDPMKEREYQDEARRLAQLPSDEQAAYLAWQRQIASDPKVIESAVTTVVRAAPSLAGAGQASSLPFAEFLPVAL
jgi:hypothetical protein